MTSKLGVAAVKARLPEVLRQVESKGDRVVVERRGRPVAVIVPYDEREERRKAGSWLDEVYGIAADIPDFERIMKDVVASRRKIRSRPVPDFDRDG